MPTLTVDVPDPPFFEVCAHPAGEPGEAVLTLFTPSEDLARHHITRWKEMGFDVVAHRETDEGRERVYPSGEAVA